MNPNPKYTFYEKVVVNSEKPSLKQINGEQGAILGHAHDKKGNWGYAVHIYRDEICWDVSENELRPTGQFDKEETFHDGSSIRVAVDKKGKGRIID